MPSFLQILAHTPHWVFGLFLLLAWLGGRQLVRHRVSLLRSTVMPVAMGLLSLYGVVSVFGEHVPALAAWAVAALAAAGLLLRHPLAADASYDSTRRQFDLPGSPVPLVLMMGIFFTKYAVGVVLALHPALAHDAAFAVCTGTLYGAFSGIFAARALRLWRRALPGRHGAMA